MLRFRNSLLIILSLLMSACGEAVDPCPEGCSGPPDLVISELKLTLPRSQTVFSGDTLTVSIGVRNRGGETSDSLAIAVAALNQHAFIDAFVEPIRAGAISRVQVRLKLPPLTRPTTTRDSLHVQIARFEHDGNPIILQTRITEAFTVTPSYMEVLGVPAVLRIPSQQIAQIRVVNPSPHRVPKDTIKMCGFDYDFCFASEIESFVLPETPGGATSALPLPITIGRDRFSGSFYRPFEGKLQFCYSSFSKDLSCGYAVTEFQPDYEKFCNVRPLTFGVPVDATPIGRNCGVGANTERDDLNSVDAEAGNRVSVTADGAVNQLVVFNAIGDQLASVTRLTQPMSVTFTAATAGRYYIRTTGDGAYRIAVTR